MSGDKKKKREIEELLREIQLSNEHLTDKRPFEPPPGYAWGHANLPEIWKGKTSDSQIHVIKGHLKKP